jgi:hypothetical protein
MPSPPSKTYESPKKQQQIHFFNVFEGSRKIVELERRRKESGGSWSSLSKNASQNSGISSSRVEVKNAYY